MSGTPQVIVLNGPLAGTVVEIASPLSIGRRPENKLRLRDDQVSRQHALIEKRGDTYVIEDLGSRTGTIVDGAEIKKTAVLHDGMQIVIGQTVLQFNAYGDGLARMVTSPSSLVIPPQPEPRTESLRVPVNLPTPQATDHTGPTLPPPRRKSSRGSTPVHVDARGASVITLVPVDRGPFADSLARKDAAELRRAGEHLQTLLSANSIISSELDLDKLFEKILDQIFNTFPAHRAVIMTKPSDDQPLSIVATRTAVGRDDNSKHEVVSQTIVNRAFKERVGVLTLDAGQDSRFDTRQSVVDMNIRSAICVPMVHHDSVLGVIYLDTVGITHAFKEDDLRLLTGIAGPAGGAVRNALLVQKLRATAVDTILRLAIAAEYRDDDTGFHIHRMSDYAEAIARALGKPSDFCDTLKLAAPMHDVGKIGIPDSILKKPGRLTKEEFEEMKQHTVKGGAILSRSDSDLLKMAEQIALTHHEKFDGSGYPRGISRQEIPIEGRIVAVADVFDALTTKRCYKNAFSIEEAVDNLTDGAGKHFDPQIIDCFMSIKDRILTIRDHYLKLEELESQDLTPSMSAIMQRRPPRAPV